MTAAEIIAAKFGGTLRYGCPACGLLDDVEVVTEAPHYRWAAIRCRCGTRLATVEPPDVLVPFGYNAGALLQDQSIRDLDWLHGAVSHPWILDPCCALLGCDQGCAPTWRQYVEGIVTPAKAEKNKERAAYVKQRAAALRASRRA